MWSTLLIALGLTMCATSLALILGYALHHEVTRDRPRWTLVLPPNLDPHVPVSIARAVVKHLWVTGILIAGIVCCVIGFISGSD